MNTPTQKAFPETHKQRERERVKESFGFILEGRTKPLLEIEYSWTNRNTKIPIHKECHSKIEPMEFS